jgi:hypothetical protein
MVAAVRTFLTLIVIIVLVAGAAGAYLYFTTPHETAGVAFPLSAESKRAIAAVPSSAESFVYVPTAAALDAKLKANPITRDAMAAWSSDRALPSPWILGRGDLVAWQSGKETRYLLRVDPLRATLVRTYLTFKGGNGAAVLINAPIAEPIPADEVATIERLAAKLPAGDALVVQRSSARGAFPPIGRPAVSSVQVAPSEILITTVGPAGSPLLPGTGGAPPVLTARFPRGALLSATFTSPPRVFDDLNRLFGKRVSDFVGDGGSVSLYDVDTGKLLPRPLGVISVPATAERRPTAEMLNRYGARTAERGDELIISFDRSIDTYLKDTADLTPVPGGRWAARIDARRLAPILDRVKDSMGLRIASPRLYRGARDLDRWIGSLRAATTITATAVTDGSTDELKVRISAK